MVQHSTGRCAMPPRSSIVFTKRQHWRRVASRPMVINSQPSPRPDELEVGQAEKNQRAPCYDGGLSHVAPVAHRNRAEEVRGIARRGVHNPRTQPKRDVRHNGGGSCGRKKAIRPSVAEVAGRDRLEKSCENRTHQNVTQTERCVAVDKQRSRRTRTVHFDRCVRAVLIPCRRDLDEATVQGLWWGAADMRRFCFDACCFFEQHGKHSEVSDEEPRKHRLPASSTPRLRPVPRKTLVAVDAAGRSAGGNDRDGSGAGGENRTMGSSSPRPTKT